MTAPAGPLAVWEAELAGELGRLAAAGLRRQPALPAGIDFSSNDYLGLGRDAALARRIAEAVGRAAENAPESLFAPASRLLRGESLGHRRLEARLAAFKGTEAALLFPSGYQANVALLSALLGAEDRALSDAWNHASLIDGLRLSGCRREIVPHLDLDAYERRLAEPWPRGRTVVVVESLFSMDGDLAPLAELADLADRFGALLIVDDAHATGVYGEARGSGLVEAAGIERRVAASVSTFGKAFALQGAAIAGSQTLIDWIVNRARPFVFSTAVSPLLLVALDATLDHLAERPELRLRTRAQARLLRDRLVHGGVDVPAGESPIVPVVVGENGRALEVAAAVQRAGFDVRAVRPPTVPAGTARLRLSVHADQTVAEVQGVADAVAAALARGRSAA